MPSITIRELIGAYDADNLQIRRDGNGDAGLDFNRAFSMIGTGVIIVRGNCTYRIATKVTQPSTIEVVCFDPVPPTFQLAPSTYVDVWEMNGGAKLRRVKIDGNRANNALGTRYGLFLNGCTDAVAEEVEVINARSDGMRLEACERCKIIRPTTYNNGGHGVCLSNSAYNTIDLTISYDNCRVSTAGAKDGIRLELLSHDNSITHPHCYETAFAGQLHGFGVREAIGEGCYRYFLFGGSQLGNVYGGG